MGNPDTKHGFYRVGNLLLPVCKGLSDLGVSRANRLV